MNTKWINFWRAQIVDPIDSESLTVVVSEAAANALHWEAGEVIFAVFIHPSIAGAYEVVLITNVSISEGVSGTLTVIRGIESTVDYPARAFPAGTYIQTSITDASLQLTFLALEGGTMAEGAMIEWYGGSIIKTGTISSNAGDIIGLEFVCAAGYGLKWENGVLYHMNQGGTIIHVAKYFETPPTTAHDETLGFAADSRVLLRDGRQYKCTDPATGAAVWVEQFYPMGLTPGTYTNVDIVVGEDGKITSVSNGTGGGGGGITLPIGISDVDGLGTALTGIADALDGKQPTGSYLTSIPNTSVTAGSYAPMNATVGADGRLTAASRSVPTVVTLSVVSSAIAVPLSSFANALISYGDVSLTGDATLSNPTGSPVERQRIVFSFKQDSTGGRAITLGSSYSDPNGFIAKVAAEAANKTTIIGVQYHGSPLNKWLLVSAVAGY